MLNKKILTLVFVVAFLTLITGCIPQNETPIITSDPVKTGEVGVPYTYDVEATDPDEDVLTYSLDIKPTGMDINSTTGLINWIPTTKGEFNVVVKVSDGDLDITQSFTITVIEEEPGVTPTPVQYYLITATAGINGSIDPLGEVVVLKGSDKTFTITPDTDYQIANVLVDGVSVGAVTAYNFTNVIKWHTIHATFKVPIVIDGILTPGEWDAYCLGTSITDWSGGMSVDVYGFADSNYLYVAYEADTTQPGWGEAVSFCISANLGYWTPSTTEWPDPGYTILGFGGDGIGQTDGNGWNFDSFGGWDIQPGEWSNEGIEFYVGDGCYFTVPNPNVVEVKIPLSLLTYAGNDGLIALSGQYWQYDSATPFYIVLP